MIVGNDNRVRFINNWVKDMLPRMESGTETSIVIPRKSRRKLSSSAYEEELNPADSLSLQAFLNAVRSEDPGSEVTLADLISGDAGLKSSTSLLESASFSYISPAAKEYHFTLKKCRVQYKKELCSALVIDDHTSVRELSTLGEKYRRILLASVVHDIRTPIQGIIGILDGLDSPIRTPEERQKLQVGQNICKLLTFLTYDITDLGQMEAGKFKITPNTFSPIHAVKDCVDALAFSYKTKGIALTTSWDDLRSGSIQSDEHRYMQIIMNLLGNAMKFTSRGGSVTVTLSEEADHDLLRTEVKDTGIGIKEQEIPHLFKLFGKLQSSAGLNPNGVGLGLTICKKLSVELGGDIAVQSKFGGGSTFTFTIKTGREQHDDQSISLDHGAIAGELRPMLDTSLVVVHDVRPAKVVAEKSHIGIGRLDT